MVIKGIKGASFVTNEQITWFQQNAWLIMGISFIFWTLVLQVLLSVFKVNILKIIVLFGTFDKYVIQLSVLKSLSHARIVENS